MCLVTVQSSLLIQCLSSAAVVRLLVLLRESEIHDEFLIDLVRVVFPNGFSEPARFLFALFLLSKVFCNCIKWLLDFLSRPIVSLKSFTCWFASSLAIPYLSCSLPTNSSYLPAIAARSSFITFPQWCIALPLRCFHSPSIRSQFIGRFPFRHNPSHGAQVPGSPVGEPLELNLMKYSG
jgi:hypothetical protein